MRLMNLGARPISRVEARGNVRVNENFPVRWHLKDQEFSGTARVRNISESGMMLETNFEVPLVQNSVLDFQMPQGIVADFLPPLGRMVWSKKQGMGSANYVCGIEFVNPAQEVILRLREKVQQRLAHLEGAQKMHAVVGTVLMVILSALLAFFIFQQAVIYRNIEKSNHLMLVNSRVQADLYRIQNVALQETQGDLNEANAFLAQSEAMLAQFEAQNAKAQHEISMLKAKNIGMVKELAVLRDRMRILRGDVASLEEGRLAMRQHKSMMHDVKSKIMDLRHQAYLVRIAAQEEMDRIALANGNQGFIIKDSKPFKSNSQNASQRVKIDVSIVE